MSELKSNTEVIGQGSRVRVLKGVHEGTVGRVRWLEADYDNPPKKPYMVEFDIGDRFLHAFSLDELESAPTKPPPIGYIVGGVLVAIVALIKALPPSKGVEQFQANWKTVKSRKGL